MIIKTKINPETTKNKDLDELDQLVYEKAVDKHLKTFGEGFTDSEDDKLLAQIFASAILDAEVRNGGFDQFFFNSENLTQNALDGLKKIKAEDHHNLLALTTKIYLEQKGSLKNKKNEHLDELNEQYYKLDDISVKRQNFIKLNIQRFYD